MESKLLKKFEGMNEEERDKLRELLKEKKNIDKMGRSLVKGDTN